jgi:hypothetical protein
VAFTDSPDRLQEYANDERHARFLTEELVPDLAGASPSTTAPGALPHGRELRRRGRALHRVPLPGLLGRCCCSRAASRSPTSASATAAAPLFDRVVEFVNSSARSRKAVSERVFVSCGVYESLIYENRSMVPLLTATGMEVRFVEARDGHNWENWRDRLREGAVLALPRSADVHLRVSFRRLRRYRGSMAERHKNIGLSLGADICWPLCYEHMMKRLDLRIPHGGDTVRFEVERVTIEPFDLRSR